MEMYWYCFTNKENNIVVYLSHDRHLLIDAIAKDHLHKTHCFFEDLNSLGKNKYVIKYIFTSSLEYEHKVIR